MECTYCKETLIDGARVCRFCGRDTPVETGRKRDRRWGCFYIAVFVVVALGLLIAISPGHRAVQLAKCRRAVAINPTITEDQCMDLVDKNGDAAFRLIAPAMDD